MRAGGMTQWSGGEALGFAALGGMGALWVGFARWVMRVRAEAWRLMGIVFFAWKDGPRLWWLACFWRWGPSRGR